MSAITLPSPPAAVPRSNRRLAGWFALVVAVLLVGAACTGQERTPESYGNPGSKVETRFMEGCVNPDGDETTEDGPARDVCQCTYDEVKKQIPFEDFKKINDDLSEEPGPLPANFLAILEDCQKPS